MKQRRNGLSLIIIVVVAFGSLAYTLINNNKPALGLDLQGGISLVLAPAKKVPSDVLNQSIAIIRNRVDALGVGEPDISRQGSNIVVEIPGVKDQEKARQVVGTFFRQPAVSGPCRRQGLAEIGVDRQVGLGDGTAAFLAPAPVIAAIEFPCDGARRAHGVFQELEVITLRQASSLRCARWARWCRGGIPDRWRAPGWRTCPSGCPRW